MRHFRQKAINQVFSNQSVKKVNIKLHIPTCWALANKTADLVNTFTLIEAGGAHTLIHFYLTVSAFKSYKNVKETEFKVDWHKRNL